MKLFLDDSSLLAIASKTTATHTLLTEDVNTIHRLKRSLNPYTSKRACEVVFSVKQPIAHSPLILNGCPIAKSDSTKHLGSVLYERLNFTENIKEDIKNARKV